MEPSGGGGSVLCLVDSHEHGNPRNTRLNSFLNEPMTIESRS